MGACLTSFHSRPCQPFTLTAPEGRPQRYRRVRPTLVQEVQAPWGTGLAVGTRMFPTPLAQRRPRTGPQLPSARRDRARQEALAASLMGTRNSCTWSPGHSSTRTTAHWAQHCGAELMVPRPGSSPPPPPTTIQGQEGTPDPAGNLPAALCVGGQEPTPLEAPLKRAVLQSTRCARLDGLPASQSPVREVAVPSTGTAAADTHSQDVCWLWGALPPAIRQAPCCQHCAPIALPYAPSGRLGSRAAAAGTPGTAGSAVRTGGTRLGSPRRWLPAAPPLHCPTADTRGTRGTAARTPRTRTAEPAGRRPRGAAWTRTPGQRALGAPEPPVQMGRGVGPARLSGPYHTPKP